jgi:hypothetical protein
MMKFYATAAALAKNMTYNRECSLNKVAFYPFTDERGGYSRVVCNRFPRLAELISKVGGILFIEQSQMALLPQM